MYLAIISVFECVTTIVYEEMLSLSPTFGYRWHRLTEILWTGFSMCSRGREQGLAAADNLQWFAAADNKLIKWPNAPNIFLPGPFFFTKTD